MLSPQAIAVGFLLELQGGGALQDSPFWSERLDETLAEIEEAEAKFPLDSLLHDTPNN